jgi:hypothetical protein
MSTGNIEDVVGNGGGTSLGLVTDSVSGSLKVTEQEQPRFDDLVDPGLVNASTIPVGVNYYPDANGVSTLGYNGSLSFSGELVSGTAGHTITFTVEAANASKWIDVTSQFLSDAGAQPPAAITANNSTVTFGISKEIFAWAKYRAVITVGTGTNNSALVESLSKAV